jgi:hypothetical protein
LSRSASLDGAGRRRIEQVRVRKRALGRNSAMAGPIGALSIAASEAVAPVSVAGGALLGAKTAQ